MSKKVSDAARPKKRPVKKRESSSDMPSAALEMPSAAVGKVDAAPAGPCVVGIGASAGGFEATTALLRTIPRGANLAFVVVQHLDPHHKSLAAELFARHTKMTVSIAENGMRIEADHVYTVPADQEVTVSDSTLHLTPVGGATRLRLPIDKFFTSLGASLCERAVGVVLSGTGADGSVGIKEIVAHGGIVLVQQPDTAQYDGMLVNAIATGSVSHVLDIPHMAGTLVAYAAHPYVTGHLEALADGLSNDAALKSILEILQQTRPQTFSGYRRSTLLRRIERRMGLKSVRTLSDYATFLRADAAEKEALVTDMLIGVTSFFRDPDAWASLKSDVIDPLVSSRAAGEPIRAWVPGTSTGEEAYSLAILILEALRAAGKVCPVQVFATDANTDALTVARAGRYPLGISSQVSAQRLARYFTQLPDQSQYQVLPELRSSVVVGPQSLFSDPPYSNVDLVSCRNLLIYLDPDAQRKLILLFHFSLRPNGFLFLGPAESIGAREDLFRCVSDRWKIFRRVGTTPGNQLTFPVPGGQNRLPPFDLPLGGRTKRRVLPGVIAQKLILQNFAPASILVDEEFRTLFFCGPTDRYLTRFRGQPTYDVLAMTMQELRSRLRAALRSAAEGGTVVLSKAPRLARKSESKPVDITVMPIAAEVPQGRMFLIVFEETATKSAPSGRPGTEPTVIHQLEEELRITRADLQNTVEELEAANQELTASDEDKSAATEELQSINEELESSKEELQSLNEELHAVNQQLQNKVSELETANNDLNNLLKSSDIITICLDTNMCIRWFSPASRSIVNILPNDIGRPINHLASELLGQGLIDNARTVVASVAPQHVEVKSETDRWFLRRVLPYRISDETVDGVIVTFTDITESKRAAAHALKEREVLMLTLEDRVNKRTEQLRAMTFALSMAEERERRAVAADLHDDLGQTLALIKVKFDLLVKHSTGGILEDETLAITSLIELADERVRSLVFQLSPPVLHELGLPAALAWLAEEMKRVYGLSVVLHDDKNANLVDPIVRTIVFRAVRELLINVVRHAEVKISHVVCRHRDGFLHVTVSDGGGGFDVERSLANAAGKGHFGLANVRERLEFVGGALEVRSIFNDGTEATISVPLAPPPLRERT